MVQFHQDTIITAISSTTNLLSSTTSTNFNKRIIFLLIIIIIIGTIFYIIDLSAVRIYLPSQINFHFLHLTALSSSSLSHSSLEFIEDDDNWNWKFEYNKYKNFQDDNNNNHSNIEWNKSYFVNTIGCKMPSFPILDANIRKFIFNVQDINCKLGMTKSNNNYLWISLNRTEIFILYGVSDLDKLLCYYYPFIRKTDKKNTYIKNSRIFFKYGDIIKVADEFIKVICTYNYKQIYIDYHYFIPFKNTTNNNKNNNNNERPNIMIIGLDSVSRLNLHRQMNLTIDILLNKLNAIELYGYNKVEDNTYPNLIPVLTGLDETELTDACLRTKNNTYDECHFIWDDFKDIGYTTIFAEDIATLGLFNYLKPGFEKQTTDYNIRPIMIEMEHFIATQKKGNVHLCLGGRKPIEIILDYIKKFISSTNNDDNKNNDNNNNNNKNNDNSNIRRPHFSFFWTTSYTHDFLNYPRLIDEQFSMFLHNLTTTILNNTFLFVMSDHGIRWGDFRNTYQGMMEERQPFLFIIPPMWFREKYPLAMYNLLKNRRKLTTHYDLYETLHDLLKLTDLENSSIKQRTKDLMTIQPMPRGISLTLPIPKTRTCLMAGIAPHWCTCHEKKMITTNDQRVLKVARLIVQRINDMIKQYPQCRKLSLNLISSSTIGISNELIFTNKSLTTYFSDITVNLQTKPGYADFESTVRVYQTGNLEITGTISRTNLYGKQSQCVDDYKIKLYCFCDSFT